MSFSVKSLDNGIVACNKNIKTFEDAIDRERNTIKEYRDMIVVIQEKERIAKVKKEMQANIVIERE